MVEDEEAVRQVALRILKRYGYRVLEASHAEEALVLCERHDGPIQLLLADVVMPQLSGPELAQRVLQMRPKTKVIFTSGYTESSVSRVPGLLGKPIFIQKPFNTKILMRTVRHTLDKG